MKVLGCSMSQPSNKIIFFTQILKMRSTLSNVILKSKVIDKNNLINIRKEIGGIRITLAGKKFFVNNEYILKTLNIYLKFFKNYL
jgi:hypothetical protein